MIFIFIFIFILLTIVALFYQLNKKTIVNKINYNMQLKKDKVLSIAYCNKIGEKRKRKILFHCKLEEYFVKEKQKFWEDRCTKDIYNFFQTILWRNKSVD